MATLHDRAEADAVLIRTTAECEVDLLRQNAENDRQAAAIALEAAQAESARVITSIQRQADLATEQAAAIAWHRAREIIEAARLEARCAVTAQRNVRGRLEGTRDDIDHALDRLVEEDEDLFATIDLTSTALGEIPEPKLVPPPGQGLPTSPGPPPSRTTPTTDENSPFAEDDDGLVGDEEPTDLSPVVDLTDGNANSGPGPGDDCDEWLTAFENSHPT